MKQGVAGAEYITPLVFMIVLGTVLLNATTARMFAKVVGVFLKSSESIAIIGASDAARVIAKYLMNNGRRVVLLDQNKSYIEKARNNGIEAFDIDIYNDSLDDNAELNDVGYLIAMTGSDEVNKYAINQFSEIYGEKGNYRLASLNEVKNKISENEDVLFTPNDDYINLNESARDYPNVNEVAVSSKEDFQNKLELINKELKSIPLFVKKNNTIEVIPELNVASINGDNSIIYLGKKIEF